MGIGNRTRTSRKSRAGRVGPQETGPRASRKERPPAHGYRELQGRGPRCPQLVHWCMQGMWKPCMKCSSRYACAPTTQAVVPQESVEFSTRPNAAQASMNACTSCSPPRVVEHDAAAAPLHPKPFGRGPISGRLPASINNRLDLEELFI